MVTNVFRFPDFLPARSPVLCLGFTSRTGKAVLSLLVASVYKCKLLDLDKVLVERQLRYDLLMLTFCPEGKNQLAVDCLFRLDAEWQRDSRRDLWRRWLKLNFGV